MTTLSPPAPLQLRNAKWRLREVAQINRSGWTGRSKVVGLPGAATWTVDGEAVVKVGEAGFRPWRGWLISLRGPVASFPVRAVENQQTTASNPTVGAGATGGNIVPLTGLPATTTVLPTGSMLTVTLPSGHRRLVMLVSDLISNSSGQATASIAPELGQVPVSGASVEMQWPVALMRLTGDAPGWDVETGQIYSFQLSAEEAV